MLVSSVFGCQDDEILSTAYLHDVLEKTDLGIAEIIARFGEKVADWVEWLSKNAKGDESGYWERLEKSPWQVRLVKIADALDHLNGPTEFLPQRLLSADRALKLASSSEPTLLRAADALQVAINSLRGSPAAGITSEDASLADDPSKDENHDDSRVNPMVGIAGGPDERTRDELAGAEEPGPL